MANTIEEAALYGMTTPYRDGGSWSGWCASFCYRAGGFRRAFPTALMAAEASGLLNRDWTQAPDGALHYWGGVWSNGVENGHVAFQYQGQLLMASSKVTNRFNNADVGLVRFQDYGLPNYLGWSMAWGTEQLARGQLASAAHTPKRRRRPSMFTLGFSTVGYGYLAGPTGKRVRFRSWQDYLLLKRDQLGRLNADGSLRDGEPDTFNEHELDIIAQYKRDAA